MKDYFLNWNQLICLASSAISQIIALNNVEVNTSQSLAEEGNSQHRHCLKRHRTKADIGKSMAPIAHTHEGLVATHVRMPGQTFQGGFLFLLLFQVFVVLVFLVLVLFCYKPPLQPNPGSCTHPAAAEQKVLHSTQHNVSLQLRKQRWLKQNTPNPWKNSS